MMRKLIVFLIGVGALGIIACSPVSVSVSNQYQLSAFSAKQLAKKPMNITLLVTAPDAAAGYQTGQMLYVKRPFELDAFAKNAWINPPADMLYPLMLQSLQRTNLFEAVTSIAYTLGADYRLDTQLLVLDQNFLKRPSVLEFSAKMVLTRINDNKVLASRIINLQIPCATDTPYGGVIAANKATQQFTANLANFVVSHVEEK
jgi:cholesterol transport system auxiliary component